MGKQLGLVSTLTIGILSWGLAGTVDAQLNLRGPGQFGQVPPPFVDYPFQSFPDVQIAAEIFVGTKTDEESVREFVTKLDDGWDGIASAEDIGISIIEIGRTRDESRIVLAANSRTPMRTMLALSAAIAANDILPAEMPRLRVSYQPIRKETPDPMTLPEHTATGKVIQVLELQRAKATEVAELAREIFGDRVRAIAAHANNNALTVQADRTTIDEVARVIERLDQSGPAPRNPSDIAGMKVRWNTLKKQAEEMAVRVRENEAKEGELRAVVSESFDAWQLLREAELQEFTSRVQKMQHELDQRARVRNELVSSKVSELLADTKKSKLQSTNETTKNLRGPATLRDVVESINAVFSVNQDLQPSKPDGRLRSSFRQRSSSGSPQTQSEASIEFWKEYRLQPRFDVAEVVAAIRWRLATDETISESDREQLREILDSQMLPSGMVVLPAGVMVQGPFRFIQVVVSFGVPSQQWGTRRLDKPCEIRSHRMFVEIEINDQKYINLKLETPSDDLAQPIGDAVAAFNQVHAQQESSQRAHPPLTVDEVLAAAWGQYFQTKKLVPDDPNISAEEIGEVYAQVLELAMSQKMPEGSRLELLTVSEPGDGYRYHRWCIQLVIPSESGVDVRLTIRDVFDRCEKIAEDPGR